MKGNLRPTHIRRHHSQSDTTPNLSQSSLFTDSKLSLDVGPPYAGENPHQDSILGAHVITRSASSPLLSTSTQTGGVYAHQTFSSTNSLRLDPRYSGAGDDPFTPVIKQLSPIAEQDYFSPENQTLPLPAEDVTTGQVPTPTESQYSGVIRPSSVYSTFITRPLNRSISQASSRTHRSSSSAAPPSIPPLDLRPAFPSQIIVPPPRMPKSTTARSMSTITASSDGRGGVYDDGSSMRAESFKTAQSIDLHGTEQGIEGGPGAQNTGRSGGLVRGPGPRTGQAIGPSANSRGSQSSFTSCFEKRWRRSEGYGSGFSLTAFPKIRGPPFGISATPACWLFWGGFIAPWCWMIGGWYYTIRGERRPRYGEKGKTKELLLPMWVMAKRGPGGVEPTEEAVSQGAWFGYPFVAPAVDKEASVTSVNSRSPPTIRAKKPKTLDPWIFRCRVAAITSGMLIVIGFVIALVVVGHNT